MDKEEVFSKFIWAIGGLTEVIGQMHCSTTNEATALHWHDDESYWFTLEMREDGVYAEIDDSTDAKTMYAAIGYCQYHGISYSLIWQDYRWPWLLSLKESAIRRKEKSNG